MKEKDSSPLISIIGIAGLLFTSIRGLGTTICRLSLLFSGNRHRHWRVSLGSGSTVDHCCGHPQGEEKISVRQLPGLATPTGEVVPAATCNTRTTTTQPCVQHPNVKVTTLREMMRTTAGVNWRDDFSEGDVEG